MAFRRSRRRCRSRSRMSRSRRRSWRRSGSRISSRSRGRKRSCLRNRSRPRSMCRSRSKITSVGIGSLAGAGAGKIVGACGLRCLPRANVCPRWLLFPGLPGQFVRGGRIDQHNLVVLPLLLILFTIMIFCFCSFYWFSIFSGMNLAKQLLIRSTTLHSPLKLLLLSCLCLCFCSFCLWSSKISWGLNTSLWIVSTLYAHSTELTKAQTKGCWLHNGQC